MSKRKKNAKTGKTPKKIFDGRLFVGYKHPRGLFIEPTKEGLEHLEDYPNDDIYALLEEWTGNGWTWVDPSAIGAMTEAPILSNEVEYNDDGEITSVGEVYWHERYQIEDPVEVWREGEGVWFDSAERKMSKNKLLQVPKRSLKPAWRSDEDPILATALGAGLGSVAGLIAGLPLGAVGLGSVVGGALGGYVGAPKDRKRRGAWGGGIGGLFTPIGAAAGGAIAGRKASSRSANPCCSACAVGAPCGSDDDTKTLKSKLLR